jgi:hypothetical protein
MTEIVVNPENSRLNELVADYYNQAGKGCGPALMEMISGKTQKRAQEIGDIMGISDKDVMQLFAAVNLISLAPTKEETLQKAYEGFNRGTHGGQSTGSAEKDEKIAKVAQFVRTAVDKRWELKDKQVRPPQAN